MLPRCSSRAKEWRARGITARLLVADSAHAHLGFAIASVVSVALVVSYARLFVGWRFALVEMGVAQVIYLVLFSLTFFWEGYTGLAITIGAVVTLFLLMQLTGRFDFRSQKTQGPALTMP